MKIMVTMGRMEAAWLKSVWNRFFPGQGNYGQRQQGSLFRKSPRRKLVAASALIAVAALPASSRAEELWNAYPLRGFYQGLPAGITPPPGLYGAFSAMWAGDHEYDHSGRRIPDTGLAVGVFTPMLEYVPGVKFLGADYSVLLAQPLVYNTAFGLSGSRGNGNFGNFNTVFAPIVLGWNVGNFHIKPSITFLLPDGSSTMGDLVNGKLHNGGLPSSDNFFTVQPDLGLTWAAHGWSVSASLHVAIPATDSTAHDYRYKSGAEFAGDYTITRQFSKWTFGVVGHQINQIGPDKKNGFKVHDLSARMYGLGPLMGYQFGKIGVVAMWNRSVSIRDTVSGDILQVRLITRF